jgi:hypothetical protein
MCPHFVQLAGWPCILPPHRAARSHPP